MGRDFLNDSGQLLIRELGSTSFWSDRLLGLNFAAALDLLEQDGVVATLAQPSLTALSGETASFLAGGEFPIPIQQSLGTTTIEYKQYGVGLAFTPTVLNDGRSEEHTSELQSLMRISYAVFCLKKKKKNKT